MKSILLLLSLASCLIENTIDTPRDAVTLYDSPPALERIKTTDKFKERDLKKVDIIFVIDQSCSMSDNISEIYKNIPVFFESLDRYNLDYHIGITSASAPSGPETGGFLSHLFKVPYIARDTESKELVFSFMNSITRGSGEEGIDAAVGAMFYTEDRLLELDYPSFFREDAPLHIILISDEDDQSIVHNPDDFLSYLLDDFSNTPGTGEGTVFSAITHDPLTIAACGSPHSAAGYRYREVVHITGGVSVDICDGDWSGTMEQLARYSRRDLWEYRLTRIPVIESIQVLVQRGRITFEYEPLEENEDGVRSGDFIYDSQRNSVIFLEFEPFHDDEVIINYEVREW